MFEGYQSFFKLFNLYKSCLNLLLVTLIVISLNIDINFISLFFYIIKFL